MTLYYRLSLMAESNFQLWYPFFQGIGLNSLFQMRAPLWMVSGDSTNRGYIPLILLLHVQLALGGRWMMLR